MVETYEFLDEGLEESSPGETQWAWRNRIPKRKVTLISGDGGVGKTHSIASALTSILRREDFPDGHPPESEPGYILVVTTESDTDELGKVFRAQGCSDEDLIYIRRLSFIAKKGSKEKLVFDIDKNIEALTAAINRWHPICIFFDPLVEFHSRRDIDSHSIRGLMVKLNDICTIHNLFILATIHWNKNEKLSNHNRMSGSHQYAAGVKSVIVVMADPKDVELKHFIQDKHNLGPEPTKLAFRIEDQGAVQWVQVEGISPYNKIGEAEQWLLQTCLYPQPVRDLVANSPFTERTLRRARSNLGWQIITKEIKVGDKFISHWESISEKNNWGVGEITLGPPGA